MCSQSGSCVYFTQHQLDVKWCDLKVPCQLSFIFPFLFWLYEPREGSRERRHLGEAEQLVFQPVAQFWVRSFNKSSALASVSLVDKVEISTSLWLTKWNLFWGYPKKQVNLWPYNLVSTCQRYRMGTLRDLGPGQLHSAHPSWENKDCEEVLSWKGETADHWKSPKPETDQTQEINLRFPQDMRLLQKLF